MANPIAEIIELTEKRFTSIAPAHMKYDSEKGFAIQLLNNNGYLKRAAEDSPKFLQQAITNVAAIGLSLNPAEKLAYLIARNVKTGDGNQAKWESRIFLEPSYIGLIRLATDSGSIEWCQAECVYSDDEFSYNGPGEKPTHKFNAFKERGEFVGVYCTAKTAKGDYLTTIMDKEAVESIRGRSEAYKRSKSGPWVSDFVEMAKKTVIRNAFKTWPRTDERRFAAVAEAVHISNQNEGFEPIQTEPTLKEITPHQKEYFDRLIENGDALGMYLFEQSIRAENESAWTNLYHSFKTAKGKYQSLVNELTKKGCSLMADMIDAVRQGVDDDDDSAIIEILEDCDNEALAAICAALDGHAVMTVNAILGKMSAN